MNVSCEKWIAYSNKPVILKKNIGVNQAAAGVAAATFFYAYLTSSAVHLANYFATAETPIVHS